VLFSNPIEKQKNTTLSEQFSNPIEKQKNTTLSEQFCNPIEKQKIPHWTVWYFLLFYWITELF
jgi:hypothetical protein